MWFALKRALHINAPNAFEQRNIAWKILHQPPQSSNSGDNKEVGT
jgi:hypothetical protein